MPRTKLHLDALSVESFDVEAVAPGRGTVKGHSEETWEYTCDGPSCGATCLQKFCTITNGGPQQGTCNYTCHTCFMGDTCAQACPTFRNCPTEVGYPGC